MKKHKQSQFFRMLWKTLFILLIAGTITRPAQAQPALAFEARIAGDDARTRVVIDFDQKPGFTVHYVAHPDRIIIDLSNAALGFPADRLQPRGLFTDIRYGAMDKGNMRLVFTLLKPARLVLAELQAGENNKGNRLVLDAEIVTAQQFSELLKINTWDSRADDPPSSASAILPDSADAKSDFVIAVDAGHGGIDTGAIGIDSKTEEKQVTLDFAKALVARLNQEAGISAFLTREDDQFISLSQRVVIARQKKAGLLISLHADTLKQKDIRGATVYTISDKASDKLAADLAERENLSDQLAGVEASAEPPEVADILLDLTRRETQAFSISLAQNILSSFEGQVGTINNPHRHAGFRVLQAPDIPSVLLELGFLSNREDEKLLLSEAWRQQMAGLLAAAVTRYRQAMVANSR